MKFTIIRNSLPGKASRMLEVREAEEDIDDVGSEFEKTFDSVGSGIKVINGSFSEIRPMENAEAGPSGLNKFKPIVTSTPVYEDISDSEAEVKNENMDLNSTFNEEEYIALEKTSCDQYFTEVVRLITKTQDMLAEKKYKRGKLNKKLLKHKKRVVQLENAIEALDRMIKFGEKLPKLLDEV